MSFLAPWFLLGAAAIAGPIVFHLIRRATRSRVQFSATRFLKASPPRLQKRSTLEHPWLLLLRCLIVALLAFGFSRPFFNRDIPILPDDTTVRHTVLILDESASMQREGHWDAARNQLINWVENNALDHRLSILGVSDRVTHVMTDELWEKTPASERLPLLQGLLEGRQATWGPTHMDTGIQAALDELEQLAESSGQTALKTIRIFSDFTKGTRLSGLAGRDWPNDCVVEFDPTVSQPRNNVGLQWLGWSTIGEGPRKARISLVTSGEDQTVQLKTRLATAELYGEPLTVYSQVGDKRIYLLETPEDSSIPLTFEITGDEEPFDNALYTAPENIRTISLPYLGDQAMDDHKAARFYIERATAGLEDPLVSLSDAGENWDEEAAGLIIVNKLPTAAEAEQIRRFISQGGSALFLAAEKPWLSFVETMSGATGWQSPTLDRDYALLGVIDFEHPVFSIFADPRYSNFSNIRFWKPVAITLPSDAEVRILARFDEGPAAIVEVGIGQGKLIVWGGDWTPQASQWVLSTKFVPWLQQLVEVSFKTPSLPTTVNLDKVDSYFSTQSIQWAHLDGRSLDDSSPKHPGVYSIQGLNRPIQIALNMPAEESRTDPLPWDTWENLGVPLQPAQLIVSEALAQKQAAARNAIELEGEQKLWRWLLVATAIILAAESLLSLFISRRGAAPAQA